MLLVAPALVAVLPCLEKLKRVKELDGASIGASYQSNISYVSQLAYGGGLELSIVFHQFRMGSLGLLCLTLLL